MVASSDLGACMNACDSNANCVDVTLSGVACYLKNGIGASQTGRNTAFGARIISSKTKTIPQSYGKRKLSVVGTQPEGPRVTVAPRVHPRDLAGQGVPKMLLNALDAKACPSGCSGWGGPDSTFSGTQTVTVTSTGIR